ncbi:MAG: Dabb family protein [Betaproteobacteria bacterium]|nr:Dabb family protein [Betaproteobacteria bacterium]
MFYHIVLMRFTPEADARFFEKVEHYGRRVLAECADVIGYEITKNVASRSDGLDDAIIASFRSSQAHDDYQVSPAHMEMKTFMAPYIDRIIVLDTEVPA